MLGRATSQAARALGVSVAVAGMLGGAGCGVDEHVRRPAVVSPPPETSTALVCDTPRAWSTVAPILETWCVGCHATDRVGTDRHGAPEGIDLDRWSVAAASADAIAAAIGPEGTMPPLGGISDEEREQVRQWVACGAEGSDPLPPDCAAPVFVDEDVHLLFEGDGAAFCARGNAIDGDLYVLGLGVEAAACLCEVTGDILVAGRTMSQLSMPLLHHVGGRFELEGMETLQTVELPRLETIDGALLLEDQPVLEVLRFDALRQVGGAVRVSRNPVLGEVDFPALESVGGPVRVLENTELSALHMPVLTDLDGTLEVVGGPRLAALSLPMLAAASRHVLLTDLPLLDALSLPALTDVGEDLILERLPLLQTLDALPALETVTGQVSISENDGLVRIEGLDSLRTVGGLSLVDNPYLEHIGALPALQVIAGDLSIERGGRLSALPALGALTEVDGRIEIAGLPALRVLDLPPALVRVDGALVVRELRTLESLRGADGLEAVGGALILARLPLLSTVDGFAVSAVGGLHLLQLGVDDVDAFGSVGTTAWPVTTSRPSSRPSAERMSGVRSWFRARSGSPAGHRR